MTLGTILPIGGCDLDIFRFRNEHEITLMEHGEIVNGIKRKTWIERYREAGEFTFVADISSNIREMFPINSFVSHINTSEIMIVENHSISSSRGETAEIEVSGRSLESYLEQRIVGSAKNYALPQSPEEYTFGAFPVWYQALSLIIGEMFEDIIPDPDNVFPYLQFMANVTEDGTVETRVVPQGDLYTVLLSILEIDNLGLKSIRPGVWGQELIPDDDWNTTGYIPGNSILLINKGVDRSSDLIIANDLGEVESSDYLWSNKPYKTAAIVSGRWVEIFYDTGLTGYDRRVMFIDGSDLDDYFLESEIPANRFAIEYVMNQRAQQVLNTRKPVILSRVETSRNAVRAKYREDYDLGDLVTVVGDYNESAVMRIIEHVEIEDETGSSEYPTLAIDT